MSSSFALAVVVLSEDSGKDAEGTIEALAKKAFRLIDGACQTQRIDFPQTDDEPMRLAVKGNRWRSTAPAALQSLIDLRRTLASLLLEGYFVIFHFDGDTAWTRRKTAVTPEQFQARIAAPVGRLVASQPEALTRLIPMVPHYSIESWLYQNTPVARRCCGRRHRCTATLRLLEGWEADPAALDEVERPKDKTCLKDLHNHELATLAYPIERAYAAGKSLTAWVNALRAVPPLVRALAQTNK